MYYVCRDEKDPLQEETNTLKMVPRGIPLATQGAVDSHAQAILRLTERIRVLEEKWEDTNGDTKG